MMFATRLSGLLLSALAIVGCGPSRDVELAPVRGIATLNGEPLTDGYVFVTPMQGRMAKGAIQPDGTFVLGTYTASDGAQIGEHPLTVLPPPAEEWAAPASGPRAIPHRYAQAQTSGLVAKVRPDEVNELRLELTTQPD